MDAPHPLTGGDGSPGARSPAQDTLVFRVSPRGFNLVGGQGRGVGWTGIVDLPADGEPLAVRVCRRAQPARVSSGAASRIIGPYWAREAVLVPVGTEHLVVFGDSAPLPDAATLVPIAAELVADIQRISPAKLLADELEVVGAVRELMEYRVEDVRSTSRHIALKAAEPLSCEVGAVLVRRGDGIVTEVVTRDWPQRLDPDAVRDTLERLYAQALDGPVLEPELAEVADDALGREQGLVARLTIPVGAPDPFAILVVAHAASRPRGFTDLCQRIGRVLGEAAESLLLQAISREALAAERDRFAREARIDGLTGLDNRVAWDELLVREEARHRRYGGPVSIVSVDLDGLKRVNDRLGHQTGDELLRTAARLLRSEARETDAVARVGGDEFLLLLVDTDAPGAARFARRLRAAARRTRVESGGDATGPDVALSVGVATARPDEPLQATTHRADSAMYAAKARRRRG